MLEENCFICCKPVSDNSTCSGDNSNPNSSLKLVLGIVGISYDSFVGDLLRNEDCETVNDGCSFCASCRNLIDIAEDLRRNLLIVKQKFADRIAAGHHRRRRRTKTVHISVGAKVLDRLADRLGQCFTRSLVAIRPKDEIPIEKLKSLEPLAIAFKQPQAGIDEAVILDDDAIDNFSDGFEPDLAAESDGDQEAPPPVKRRKAIPLKSTRNDELLKRKHRRKLLQDVSQPVGTVDSSATPASEEPIATPLTLNPENNDNIKSGSRPAPAKKREPIDKVLESSTDKDALEASDNDFTRDQTSSENSDSSSSESENDLISTRKQRELKRCRDYGRAKINARYEKGELSSVRFRCGQCPLAWAIMSKLVHHVKSDHGALRPWDRSYGCAICPAMFRTPEDLKNHVIHYTIAKGQKEDCLLCAFSDDFPVLAGHYFKEHGLDFLKGKYFGCVQCLEAFKSSDVCTRSGSIGPNDLPAFKLFAEKHRGCSSPEAPSNLQQCRICPETRLTAAELISHEVTHSPELYCTFCDFEFDTERGFKAHNSIFHRQNAGFKTREVKPRLPNQCTSRTSRCNICGKWFSNEKNMQAHAMIHAAEGNAEKNPSAKYDETKEHQCLICEYKFSTFHLIYNHTTMIHNLKLKLFSQSDDLFCSCFGCSALFEPSDPTEIPGRLLLKDKQKYLEFAAEHAICNREPIYEFRCSHCVAKFAEPKYLFKHMLGNHSKKYPCHHCYSEFESNVEYLHHLRQQHSERIDLKCQCYRCGKYFRDIEALQTHALESYKLLKCPGCDQKFQGSESYQVHKCTLDKVPEPEEVRSTEVPAHCTQLNGGFPCLSCQKTFDTVTLLSLHFQEHHDKAEQISFNCGICSTVLSTSETFQKNGDETFYSTNDSLKHPTFTSLCTKHWKTCTSNLDATPCCGIGDPLFQCYLCHKDQDSPQSLATHLNEHHEVVVTHRCQACSSIFDMTRRFENHLNSSHNLQSCGSEQYYCRICCEPFQSTNLEMKLGSVAGDNLLEFHAFLDRHFQCKAKKVTLICRHCQREFSNAPGLLLHDVRIHSKKYFQHYCEQCGKGYADVASLNHHIQRHEMKDGKREKPTCHICGKSFSTSKYLKLHVASHKQPPMVCQYCGKGFGLKQQLVRHEKGHLEVKPTEPTVPCPICGKLFLSLAYMKYHVTWTHEKRQTRKKKSSKFEQEN